MRTRENSMLKLIVAVGVCGCLLGLNGASAATGKKGPSSSPAPHSQRVSTKGGKPAFAPFLNGVTTQATCIADCGDGTGWMCSGESVSCTDGAGCSASGSGGTAFGVCGS
ncbi:MAG: hypothetical protein M3O15_02415 [Acidobacteriota bacterium]|nr:hypothetical protein [Acidobacteriota bacterium]